MKRLGWLPVDGGDFCKRDESGERQWNKVSQALQQLTVEADKLGAIVNGLKRVLEGRRSSASSATRRAASASGWRSRRTSAISRAIASASRSTATRIDMGRAQSGFGDQRYVEDDQVRAALPRGLRARGGARRRRAGLGRRRRATRRSIQPCSRAPTSIEHRLEATRSRARAQRAASKRRRAQDADRRRGRRRSRAYARPRSARPGGAPGRRRGRDAELRLVRDRLKSIVLRADVGIVQEAWEVREEQRRACATCSASARARSRCLNDELREVLDDAEERPVKSRARFVAVRRQPRSPVAVLAASRARSQPAREREAGRVAPAAATAAPATPAAQRAAPARPATHRGATPAAPRPTAAASSPRPCRRTRRSAAAADAGAAQRLRSSCSEEARDYEKDAKDYRALLTMIVRHHYEERRKRVLAALDREIEIEKQASRTRATRPSAPRGVRRALQRHERRSAGDARRDVPPRRALRRARAREDRRRHRRRARAGDRALPAHHQRVSRSTRRSPRFTTTSATRSPTPGASTRGSRPGASLVCSEPLHGRGRSEGRRQDRSSSRCRRTTTTKFWNDWDNTHPIPLDQAPASGGATPASRGARPARRRDEELTFVDPYDGCKPIPQNTLPGDEPRYVAEVWWQLGNYHFDQIDPRGGPYNLNRAVSAYEHSMEYKKPPLYGVVDVQAAPGRTSSSSATRPRSTSSSAARTTPTSKKRRPAIPARTSAPRRTRTSPARSRTSTSRARRRGPVHPAQRRARHRARPAASPSRRWRSRSSACRTRSSIPQDKKWTVEIYKALAQEFIEITQNRNAVAMLELTLAEVPDGPRRAGDAEQGRRALRSARAARAGGSAARAEYGAQGARGAHQARRLRRHHAVGRREPGRPGGAPDRRAARARRPEARRRRSHELRARLLRARRSSSNDRRAARAARESDRRVPARRDGLERVPRAGSDGARTPTRAASGSRTRATGWSCSRSRSVARPSRDEVERARDSGDRRARLERGRQVPAAVGLLRRHASPRRCSRTSTGSTSDATARRASRSATEVKFVGRGRRTQGRARTPCRRRCSTAISARDEYNERIPLDRDPQKNGLLYAFQVGRSVLRLRPVRRSAQALRADLRPVLRQERVGLQGVGEAHQHEQLRG